MVTGYSDFWIIVKDFQALIAALIGLSAVAGGLVAIFIQQWFHRNNSLIQQKAKDDEILSKRIQTAKVVSVFLEFEKKVPQESLFDGLSRQQIADMLEQNGSLNITAKEYIESVLSVVEPLSAYPKPIGDRVVCIAWAMGRISVASSRVERYTSGGKPRKESILKTARDIEINIEITIFLIKELEVELSEYIKKGAAYEDFWGKSSKSDRNGRLGDSTLLDIAEIQGIVSSKILDEKVKKRHKERN